MTNLAEAFWQLEPDSDESVVKRASGLLFCSAGGTRFVNAFTLNNRHL